jgi:prepilin peptidase CpaA
VTLVHFLLLSIFPALVIVAAVTDIASYTIPNRLNLVLAAAYPAAALMLGHSPAEIGVGLAIGFAALIVGMGLFAAGWIGGGDAKLFAAVALWLGWPALVSFIMATSLTGGALALLLLNARAAWVRPYLAGAPPWLARLTTTDEPVPYGVAIAVGALVAFPLSALVRGLPASF